MFALVEDETLHTLNLSSNSELSRTTGKSLIKVLERDQWGSKENLFEWYKCIHNVQNWPMLNRRLSGLESDVLPSEHCNWANSERSRANWLDRRVVYFDWDECLVAFLWVNDTADMATFRRQRYVFTIATSATSTNRIREVQPTTQQHQSSASQLPTSQFNSFQNKLQQCRDHES